MENTSIRLNINGVYVKVNFCENRSQSVLEDIKLLLLKSYLNPKKSSDKQ